MLSALEGVIRRRLLLNFRMDPGLVAPLLPEPLEVLTHSRLAIVGVCLIGIERLRPKGLPSWLGLRSENMAHRIAIRYPTSTGMSDGVFIWRRDTDHCLVSLLGGRLFPGVHQSAAFTIDDSENRISICVRTHDGAADVRFEASYGNEWHSQSVFSGLDDAAEFRWEMSPLHVNELHSAFFQSGERFPVKAVQFDCALLMRGIPHEWHEVSDVPELAGAIQK